MRHTEYPKADSAYRGYPRNLADGQPFIKDQYIITYL